MSAKQLIVNIFYQPLCDCKGNELFLIVQIKIVLEGDFLFSERNRVPTV